MVFLTGLEERKSLDPSEPKYVLTSLGPMASIVVACKHVPTLYRTGGQLLKCFNTMFIKLMW